MNQDRDGKSPIDNVLERLCDDALTAEDRGTLREQLRGSKEAREAYISYVSLHFWLRSRFLRLRPSLDESTDEITAAISPTSRWLTVLPIALAASFFLAASIGIYQAWQPSSRPVSEYRHTVGVIVASHECQWAKQSDARRVGQVLRSDDRLELISGAVEVRFDTGVRLLARGPVALDSLNASRCNLEYGEISVEIGSSTRGFLVQTGAMEVVDLGTAFSMRRLPTGWVELEVTEGEIAIYDTSKHSKGVKQDPIATLGENQSATASSYAGEIAFTLRTDVSFSGDFLREMPSQAKTIENQMQGVFAFDGFAGVADGTPLVGVDAGFGWDGEWRSDKVVFNTTDVLGFAAKATNKGAGNAAVHRDLLEVHQKNSPLYASARFQISGSDSICTAWVLLFDKEFDIGAGESNLLAFGVSDGKFSARLASATQELTQLAAAKWTGDTGEYTPGATHTLVVRLEFDAIGENEVLSLWVDPPTSPHTAPPKPTHIERRNTGRTQVDSLAIRFWEMDGETRGYIDDVRVGTTWQSVVD